MNTTVTNQFYFYKFLKEEKGQHISLVSLGLAWL